MVVVLLTGCHADIVEGEVSHTGVELEQKGERLANATGGTQNSHLGQLSTRRVSTWTGDGSGKRPQILLFPRVDAMASIIRQTGWKLIPGGPRPKRHGAGCGRQRT